MGEPFYGYGHNHFGGCIFVIPIVSSSPSCTQENDNTRDDAVLQCMMKTLLRCGDESVSEALIPASDNAFSMDHALSRHGHRWGS